MEGLGATVRKNIRCRTAERHRESETDVNDSQMLWMLWRHLRTTERLQVSIEDNVLFNLEAPFENTPA